jgi:hypothetical protein
MEMGGKVLRKEDGLTLGELCALATHRHQKVKTNLRQTDSSFQVFAAALFATGDDTAQTARTTATASREAHVNRSQVNNK